MFGHGAGSIISRELGAKDRENAGIVVSTGFFMHFYLESFITLTGILFMNPQALEAQTPFCPMQKYM